MKKLLTILLIITCLSFKADAPNEKQLEVKMNIDNWSVYLRNVDRLNAFAGRNVPSEILLTTKDTVSYYQQLFIKQLTPQIDTTKK